VKALQHRVRQAARDARVSQPIVERDYAQSYVLLGLASRAELRDSLVFKGGSALKKVHLGNYRFSEDLDFSGVAAPTGPDLEHAIRAAVAAGQSAAREYSARSVCRWNVTPNANRIPAAKRRSSSAHGSHGSGDTSFP
jgi:hypothetical protein